MTPQAIYHFVCECSLNKQHRTNLVNLDHFATPLKPTRQTAYKLFKAEHPDKPSVLLGEDGKPLIGQWNLAASQAFARLTDDEKKRLEDEANDINTAQAIPENQEAMSEAICSS